MFVLGAGASKPYGFPTGEELLDSVLRGMSLEPGWRSHLAKLEFDQKQVDAFRRDFLESGQPSVDLFVEHRPEYERLGKAAIALGLIPRENHSWVFPPPDTDAPHDHNDNWYQYIFEKMNAPFDQFGENQVSFVTFNYDRSLEHFFRTAVRRSYGKSLAEADAVLKKIPIVHVHGSLGALDSAGRFFGPELSTEHVRIAMDGIEIMTYASDSSEKFEEARRLLASAERIFFLGFGYHESNMNRLQVADYQRKIDGGTSLGLGRAERADIQAQWGVPMFIQKPWAQDLNTLGFLKNCVRFFLKSRPEDSQTD